MIEKKTHTTSGSGSAMNCAGHSFGRAPRMNQVDAGGGLGAGSTPAPSSPAPNATAAAPTTTSPPGTAPAEGSRTFTQEQVDAIVQERLGRDRASRGNAPAQTPAQRTTGQQSPAPGMMSVDEVERVIERNTAFERVTAPANLNEAQRSRMLSALRSERPEDVAVWSRQYLDDMGLGRSVTPPTTPNTPNGNMPAPTSPPTAAPSSAAGNKVNPITSGGLVDFWRMPPAQLEAMGGTQLRQEYEKQLAEGKRASGAPPVPSVVRRK